VPRGFLRDTLASQGIESPREARSRKSSTRHLSNVQGRTRRERRKEELEIGHGTKRFWGDSATREGRNLCAFGKEKKEPKGYPASSWKIRWRKSGGCSREAPPYEPSKVHHHCSQLWRNKKKFSTSESDYSRREKHRRDCF